MRHVTVDFERLKTLHCGLGQYSLHLGRWLAQLGDDDLRLCYFLPQKQACLFSGLDVEFDYVRNWRRETWLRSLRPMLRMVPHAPIDLWHLTHQNAKYLPVDPRVPVLLTIHDLNFLHGARPGKVARELRKVQRLVDRAVAITTISQFVATEVREHLDLRGKPLHVIYNGAFAKARSRPTRPGWLPEGKFLFTIGDITPKKNFHVLVDFLKRTLGYRLVIAGNKQSSYAIELSERIRELQLGDRIFLPGPVSDDERAWLYAHCEALVFPSLAEGFGLPVIEAMSHGRPVFVSHSTSLPEVAGPLGFYWHDYSPQHMAEVFAAGLSTVAADAHYADKLKQYAAQFTWQRAAEGYLDVYRATLEALARKKVA